MEGEAEPDAAEARRGQGHCYLWPIGCVKPPLVHTQTFPHGWKLIEQLGSQWTQQEKRSGDIYRPFRDPRSCCLARQRVARCWA